MATKVKSLKQKQKGAVIALFLLVFCIMVTAASKADAGSSKQNKDEKVEQMAETSVNDTVLSEDLAMVEEDVSDMCDESFPEIGEQFVPAEILPASPAAPETGDSIFRHSLYVDSLLSAPRKPLDLAAGRRHRGYRFRTSLDYAKGFPDLNDVQLATASKLGIPLISDRDEAVKRKDELVFIGENPYYVIDKLSHSIPYLTPRAACLLEDISRSLLDSLAVRGMDFYKPLVTSVLRTEQDVKRLRRVNCNATEKSCHQYGTTFDISYSKFIPVFDPSSEGTDIWPAALKQILAEVLDDQRRMGTCYIKYESHQSCFHITVR